ncbi:hypothetical protein Poli38472_008546 [Pythium oligandrum]|uniref:Uncharacterized protein n=1 Tax=Pythium oligandrum TaxID=41045 RepID=A0A8K1C3Y1_PYTOL|nr:hypothetical protein Poli38472_008546 [Pythium oligandrum]|eukprot:TMW55898.1 hypothetical protein Poli38472_008546 [Pythium oligandrum]
MAVMEEVEDATGRSVALELLERARRLCLAANELALPQLQGQARDGDSKAAKPRKPELPSSSNAPRLPILPKKKRVLSAQSNKDREQSRDALPQINVTEEWRKQREAERVRQAQERAQARVLRISNQFDPCNIPEVINLPTNITNMHSIEDEQTKQEKIRQGQARAHERVRRTRQRYSKPDQREVCDSDTKPVTPEHPEKVGAFKRQTLERLRRARQKELDIKKVQVEPVESRPEVEFDDPDERKRLEKERRRETAQRLKRIQALADEQKRKEQEQFEQGLSAFKSKRQELDRVAKGLSNHRRSNLAPVGLAQSIEEGTSIESQFPNVQEASSPSSPARGDTDKAHLSVKRENAALPWSGLTIKTDPQPTAAVSSGFHDEPAPSRHSKLPPWKRPPVPILPTTCYSYKAIISSTPNILSSPTQTSPQGSYAQRFDSRYTVSAASGTTKNQSRANGSTSKQQRAIGTR